MQPRTEEVRPAPRDGVRCIVVDLLRPQERAITASRDALRHDHGAVFGLVELIDDGEEVASEGRLRRQESAAKVFSTGP